MYKIIFLMGLVSFFADITAGGAKSIIGPFLYTLGASPIIIGFIAGLGEFAGHTLRFIFGYIVDKTKKYWSFTIGGYLLSLFSIPLLSFALNWQIVGFLVFIERVGKAIRTPARDTILSFAIKKAKYGIGFGIHKVLDQFGEFLGPIFVSFLLYLTYNDYKKTFLWLIIPSIFALVVLIYTKSKYKFEIENLNNESTDRENNEIFNPIFWIYLISLCFIAVSYADFPIIAYHVKLNNLLSINMIPILYAIGMITAAFSAIFFGFLFDKIKYNSLILGILFSLFYPIFAFSYNLNYIFFGIFLWGIGIGIQDSITRSVVANLISPQNRGKAFGIFHSLYGFSWLIGSTVIGYLYSISLHYLILFSILFQIFAIIGIVIMKNVSLKE